jgi:hypothetical protein
MRAMPMPFLASPRRAVRRVTLCAGSALLIDAAIVAAQPPSASPTATIVASATASSDFEVMRDELRSLREEVDALRAELASLRGAVVPASNVLRTTVEQQVTPEQLEILKTQVEEQAQSKVESASKMPVRLFGAILSNTVFNSHEANWLENPNLVSAPPPGALQNGSLTSTLRQSRIGLNIGTIPVGSLKGSGSLVMDFFGGVPNFQNGTVMGLPRLIIAFGRLENDKLALEVGQDRAMLAPRDPTSLAALSFPLFFRSGNLYLRVPQARVEYRPSDAWTFQTGIVSPLAGDFSSGYEFAPVAGAGERSKRPAIEGHAGFARGNADGPGEVALGASGHYGWRRTSTSLLDKVWAGAVDGNVRLGRIGAAGEWFIVENGEVFGGAVNQGGRAQGGWVEGRFELTSRASVNGGFGLDRPEDATGRLVRAENRSAFANTIVRLSPELGVSFEYRWLETRLGLVPVVRRNHHINAVFAVNF